MLADTDLQVWLDAAQERPAVIIPYVRSGRDDSLEYSLQVLRKSASGTSRISQRGSLDVKADVPKALSRLSLSGTPSTECRIELTLTANGHHDRHYVFECPS